MAGTEEREDSECGDAGIGVPPCPAAILAENHLLVARAELISIPAAIAGLRGSEPTQCGNDGVFGFCIPTLTLDQAESVGSAAQRIRIARNRRRCDRSIRMLTT